MIKINYTILILTLLFLSLIFVNNKISAGEVSNGVIINEIMFDPVGSDLGYEWIELYNPTDLPISITNWKVLIAGSTFTQTAEFSGLIPSHEYYLVCEQHIQGCNVYVAKLGMQNGGGATDALTVTNSTGTVLDQIFYDLPNSNNLKGEDGNIVSDLETATIGINGESLGREDFIDTNDSANDFLVYSSSSPGSENIGELIEEELPQTGDSPIFYLIILIILIISGILLNKHNLFLIKKWLRQQKIFQHQ